MQINIIIALIFLGILSVIDIWTFRLKKGFIPRALTTSFIIIMFIANPNAIIFVFSALVGMLLTDLFNVWGFADVKIFVALGLTMDNIFLILIFTMGLLSITILYQYAIKLLIKRKIIKPLKEIPYIPVMLLTYAIAVL